jgi:hypothetical protein
MLAALALLAGLPEFAYVELPECMTPTKALIGVKEAPVVSVRLSDITLQDAPAVSYVAVTPRR